MKHYGDITKMRGDETEPVWLITGGSPCQDLSVAGKRAGLAGERSGLFMEMIRIIKEMRAKDEMDGRAVELIRPRFVLWENVPGALSSNNGEDFRCVLEEFACVKDETVTIPRPPKGKWANAGHIVGDGWSLAWRIRDAQYWGVPQRLRRIALLVDYGGMDAGKIVFEQRVGREPRLQVRPFAESVPGDSESGGEAGQGAAGGPPGGAGASSGLDACSSDLSYTLKIRGGVSSGIPAGTRRARARLCRQS
jgi:DNA (cytosine-5)-methyltransferase 1